MKETETMLWHTRSKWLRSQLSEMNCIKDLNKSVLSPVLTPSYFNARINKRANTLKIKCWVNASDLSDQLWMAFNCIFKITVTYVENRDYQKFKNECFVSCSNAILFQWTNKWKNKYINNQILSQCFWSQWPIMNDVQLRVWNYCDVCRKPRHFRFSQRCC
jgi:hypothetical protein